MKDGYITNVKIWELTRRKYFKILTINDNTMN